MTSECIHTTGSRAVVVLVAALIAIALWPGTAHAATINGTNGRDWLHGTRWSDYVDGRGGDDFINVSGDSRRDRGDWVRCGRGYDVVIADRNDRISGDCERVRIRRRGDWDRNRDWDRRDWRGEDRGWGDDRVWQDERRRHDWNGHDGRA